jgi:hypothetical protein
LRTRIRLVVVLMAFLVALGAWGDAQTLQPRTPAGVISGSDFGFRVDRRKGNTPIGTLVVRINGQWVEVQFSAGTSRLTAR